MSGRIVDWSRDDLEWELRMEQLRADIGLKKRQEALELPKFLVAALVATGTLFAAVFTAFGYALGHH
jgi:hypothetical protein